MRLTRRQFIGLGIAVASAPAALAVEGRSVVLIASDPDPDLSLETLALRKLFLGFTILHDRHALRPIRNRSDARLDEIFMQHVVSMSAEAYERRLLSLSLQQGRPRPLEVRSRGELLAAIAANPHAISFAWRSEVADVPGIHVVRTIWRE